jgi:hypothetical protein
VHKPKDVTISPSFDHLKIVPNFLADKLVYCFMFAPDSPTLRNMNEMFRYVKGWLTVKDSPTYWTEPYGPACNFQSGHAVAKCYKVSR